MAILRYNIERVIEHINMNSTKTISMDLTCQLNLSKQMCPITKKEKRSMGKFPHSFTIGGLMYATMCTKPNIGHAFGVVSRFHENPGKEYLDSVKWILRYLRGASRDYLYFGGSKPILMSIPMLIW